MKILFFTRRFWPEIGGVEKHVLEVSKCLAAKGHEVTVVTEKFAKTHSFGKQSDEESATIAGAIKVLRMPFGGDFPGKKYKIWNWLWQNKRHIEAADIVHCHDVYFWYLPFRLLYQSKPSYVTFHGYETEFPPRKKAILIRRLSEKLAQGNICIGDYIAKWYGTKPTLVSYGGVKANKSAILTRASSNHVPTILFLGRLEPDNNVLVYLSVLKRLKEQGVPFRFFVAGDGTLRKDAEKFGKVLGFLPDVQRKIDESDIIFSSSYLSMLEGLANQKLVICAYSNNLKKDYLLMSPFREFVIIGDNGNELSKDVSEYLRDSKSSKFDKKKEDGYRWARGETWDKVSKLYLELWNKDKKTVQ